MAEPCPNGRTLRAFNDGKLSGPESDAVLSHLEQCLPCAREVDRLTRELLDTFTPTHELIPEAQRSAVAQIIAEATAPDSDLRHTVDRTTSVRDSILQKLAPSSNPGELGRFGRYHVLDVAGSGGMAVVFRAHDPVLDRIVALKVVAPRFAASPEDSARFLTEARAMAALRHDHIAIVHSVGTVEGLPYLVMPFYAEGHLDRWVTQHGPLSELQVVQVGLQLARALEHAHSKGLIHRDLKPSNVLVDVGLDRLVLADFGLVETVDPARDAGGTLLAGTYEYMAPEQARGEKVDEKADLYALGALLYHLVEGRPPRAAALPEQMKIMAEAGAVEPMKTTAERCSAPLVRCIQNLLSPHPDHRPSTATEVVAQMEKMQAALLPKSLNMRRILGGLGIAALLASLLLILLEITGVSTLLSTTLCLWRGDSIILRGQFRTFKSLPDALAAARHGDVVELRFTGEQTVPPIQLTTSNLTLRAAPGFFPALVAAEIPQPWMLLRSPLKIQGITIARRGGAMVNYPLFLVENTTLTLEHCSLVRMLAARTDRIAQRALHADPADDAPSFRPLIALVDGSTLLLSHSILRGFGASGIEIRERNENRNRATVDIQNCHFFVNSAFVLKGQSGLNCEVKAHRTALLFRTLLEVPTMSRVHEARFDWDSCTFEKSRGTLLRTDVLPVAGQNRLKWSERNVVYSAGGLLALASGRQRMNDALQWREWFGLRNDAHREMPLDLFPLDDAESPGALHADELAMVRKLAMVSPGTGPDPHTLGPRARP